MIDNRFSIGEAAKRTGLSVKAIRHYATEGIVPPSAVSEAGYRLYSTEDLWRLGLVRVLRQLEFGLPEIRKILARSLDVSATVRLQREALDLQILRLGRVRSLLARVPERVWGEASLHHLTTVLGAMQMDRAERERWIAENWSRTMMEGAPDAWRESFLQQVRGILPEDLDADQAEAWGELQKLLSDPRYQTQMREAIQPFWSMVQATPVQPDAWTSSMGDLTARARELYERGLAPGHPDVQALVDDWINVFATAVGTPVTPAFMERFVQYAEQYASGPSRQLWDVMRRLNPERLQPEGDAQMLMLEGLRWRMQDR